MIFIVYLQWCSGCGNRRTYAYIEKGFHEKNGGNDGIQNL